MAYDVFLSYNSLDRPIVSRVAGELEKRRISCFIDQSYLLPGRDWVAALETALADSRSVAVFIGPHGMGRWQQRERAWALDRQAEKQDFAVIPVLLPECEPPLGFLKQMTWIDLREDPPKAWQLDALAAAIGGESATEDGRHETWATICPYRGLMFFREEDAAFFFGRRKYTDKLVKMVEQRSFVAVVGASGSGKSSVVRAGLVPRLRSRDQESVWDIVTMVPGEKPLQALADVILPLVEPELTGISLLRQRNAIAKDLLQTEPELPLDDLIHSALKRQRGTDRLLLVVDQWEELYTQCNDAVARRRFIDELLSATARNGSPLSVVLTVRSDFYDHLLHDRALLDRLEGAKLDLGPMNEEELREAIEKPADLVGLSFQDGLVDRLLTDARDEPGRLPLLEFALEELWRRHDHGQMTHAAYEDLERLSGAIATRAEVVYEALDDAEKAAAPGLFRRLVLAGSKTEEDTRRRADLASLDETSRRVVRRLADERLLVTTREGAFEAKESASDDTVEDAEEQPIDASAAETNESVEVAHEELLRRWDRLKQWINKDRQFLQWRSRLAPALEQYQRDPKSALLRHGALREARQLYPSRRDELENDERAFLVASFAGQRRRRSLFWSIVALVAFAAWLLIGETRVRSLLGSSPEGFEYNYQQLWLYKPYAVIRLRFETANDKLELPQKLHVAFALARFGSLPDEQREFLLSEIPNAGPEERRNYFRALATVPREQLEEPLAELVRKSDSLKAKRRCATTGLQLGFAAPAMAALEKHPEGRTELIHNWEDWPPAAKRLPEILRENRGEDSLCSTICCALGLLDTRSMKADEGDSIVRVMRDLHKNADGGGTHSAAGWALRQWGKTPLPSVPRSKGISTGPRWFTNQHGMAFVLIPKGDVDPEKSSPVEVSRDFYLSDREVTVAQYQAVMGHPAPGADPTESDDPSGLRPVTYVSWYDAVEFCIELSKEEDLSPYYELPETEVERDEKGAIIMAVVKPLSGSGYRLPTEAEWEYACRAGSQREFCFGDELDLNRTRLLSDYAVFWTSSVADCGGRLPNAWGLFDMHGNVLEWCQDCDSFMATARVFRGGSWASDAWRCRAAYSDSAGRLARLGHLGFRVAAVPPELRSREQANK